MVFIYTLYRPFPHNVADEDITDHVTSLCCQSSNFGAPKWNNWRFHLVSGIHLDHVAEQMRKDEVGKEHDVLLITLLSWNAF